MKRKVTAKSAKVADTAVEFRVWCDKCSIRLAPNEEKTVIQGKSYHPGCHAKLGRASNA